MDKCAMCGSERLEKRKKEHTFENKDGKKTIVNILGLECLDCGEVYFDDEDLKDLNKCLEMDGFFDEK